MSVFEFKLFWITHERPGSAKITQHIEHHKAKAEENLSSALIELKGVIFGDYGSASWKAGLGENASLEDATKKALPTLLSEKFKEEFLDLVAKADKALL